jgi:hypothetical protein
LAGVKSKAALHSGRLQAHLPQRWGISANVIAAWRSLRTYQILYQIFVVLSSNVFGLLCKQGALTYVAELPSTNQIMGADLTHNELLFYPPRER